MQNNILTLYSYISVSLNIISNYFHIKWKINSEDNITKKLLNEEINLTTLFNPFLLHRRNNKIHLFIFLIYLLFTKWTQRNNIT